MSYFVSKAQKRKAIEEVGLNENKNKSLLEHLYKPGAYEQAWSLCKSLQSVSVL